MKTTRLQVGNYGVVVLFGSSQDADLQLFEKRAVRQGYRCIAGIDEVGRGALAGPVVAAAVVLPFDMDIPGIDDSKKLSAAKRKELYNQIYDLALAVGVGLCDNERIDAINILQATLQAMKIAVQELEVVPDYLLVDGNTSIPLNIPQKAIVKGDSSSISIAAASIVAKVTRDSMMEKFDEVYPGYGFAAHKGYGCASHLTAISQLGPCEIHRRTFRGVKEHVSDETAISLFGELP